MTETPDLNQDFLDKLAKALDELPEKPHRLSTVYEVIESLQERLLIARAKGYSYEELSAHLQKRGVNIKASTLRQYLGRLNREAKKEEARRKRLSKRSANNSV